MWDGKAIRNSNSREPGDRPDAKPNGAAAGGSGGFSIPVSLLRFADTIILRGCAQ